MSQTVTEQTAPVESAADQHRTALIAGLRELADFLAANPDVPPPYRASGQMHFAGTDEENFTAVRTAAAAMGVQVDEEEHGLSVTAKRHFGPHVELRAYASSTVRRQVWTEAMERHSELLNAAVTPDAELVAAAALTPDAPELPADRDAIAQDAGEVAA